MIDRHDFYEARAPQRPKELARHYHALLHKFYRFLVPRKMRVLELGCSSGELLAAVEPARGVGVDFSQSIVARARQHHPDLEFHLSDAAEFSAEEKFDYILMSDLVNDLTDVQQTLVRLHQFAEPHTRLVLNFFNNLWRPVLGVAEKIRAKSPTPQQNWLSSGDMKNLLHLAGWELVKMDARILWPIRTPLLEPFLNRWVAPLFRSFCLTVFVVARPRSPAPPDKHYACTVVVPARNEAGNIEAALQRIPEMGLGTEIIFIEGHSSDNTWDELRRVSARYPQRRITILKQRTKGKGGAVREAFAVATGDLLFILDADLTVPPEQLPKFYEVARSGTADFVNGVRLVYPMELFRRDYEAIVRHRAYFGDFDPFGDFDLLFGAAKLNLRIVDLPIRYQARSYGETNIQRWRHGWLLLRMTAFAARRLKFIP